MRIVIDLDLGESEDNEAEMCISACDIYRIVDSMYNEPLCESELFRSFEGEMADRCWALAADRDLTVKIGKFGYGLAARSTWRDAAGESE